VYGFARVMSADGGQAAIKLRCGNLRFRPEAVLALVVNLRCNKRLARLLDNLVGGRKQRRWHGEAERLRCFEIDDQLELGGVLHQKVGRLLSLEDAVERRQQRVGFDRSYQARRRSCREESDAWPCWASRHRCHMLSTPAASAPAAMARIATAPSSGSRCPCNHQSNECSEHRERHHTRFGGTSAREVVGFTFWQLLVHLPVVLFLLWALAYTFNIILP
jgi:hypothetical protein